MKLVRLDHVQLAMPAGGEAQARAFYAGVLGIPEAQKPADMAKRGGCWFERADMRIHLGVEADFRPARKAHVAFIVDNLPDLEQQLRTSGYTVKEGGPLDGYRRIDVDDPFGNRIELMEAS